MPSPAVDPRASRHPHAAPAPRERGPVRRWIDRHPRIRRGYRTAVGTLGGIVTALGVILLPLPGPGALVLIGGLAILGTEFAWAQRAAGWIRRQITALAAWWRRRRDRKREGICNR